MVVVKRDPPPVATYAKRAPPSAPDQCWIGWNWTGRSPLHRHSMYPRRPSGDPESAMADNSPATQPLKQTIATPPKISIALTINGTRRQLQVAPWTTLLDLLRDRLELTGTKKGCDHGQ